ncbi:MAG: cation diffusion facilitator family transporter [Oligoflexia bacterium]|nr:cation diffusion facilitator family transporter [Oligoflexia bacterium]MBF0365852.1 cation diffusion facilitator family transporter [Oligoflexia bacterium]
MNDKNLQQKRAENFSHWGMLVILFFKYFVGFFGNSKGLLADATASTVNMISYFSIVISRKFSSRPADANHPYGHGKIEFVTAVFVNGLSAAGAMAFILFSLEKMLYAPVSGLPEYTTIAAALLGVVANEFICSYLKCVAQNIPEGKSIPTSWIKRADSLIAIEVIVGVLISRLGILESADSIVAIGIMLVITLNCGRLFLEAIGLLMDKSIPKAQLLKIKNGIKEFLPANSLFELKNVTACAAGRSIFVKVAIKANENETAENFCAIANTIREKILELNPLISSVDVECCL